MTGDYFYLAFFFVAIIWCFLPQVEKKGKGKKEKQDAKAQAKAEAAAEAV